MGFPGGSDGKESAYNAGDPGSIPELGRSLGERNGYPLQYSFLKNSMDRGARQATVHRVAKSRKRLSIHTYKNNNKFIDTENRLVFASNRGWRVGKTGECTVQ